MGVFGQDLRLALRLLWKDRAFALTSILTLALCIGACCSIFTVVRSVLLRPLPYPEPERLTFMYDSFPGAGVERAGTSVPNYFDRVELAEVFDSVALYDFNGRRVGRGATAERVQTVDVTPSFFKVFRARALRGRLFTDEAAKLGSHRVAVLDPAFARRQPGGIEGSVGRELRINDEPYTVVGVLPEDFTFLDPDVRIYLPLAFNEEQRAEDRRYSQNHQAIGRLAAGVSQAQAQSRVDALNSRNVERSGPLKSALLNTGYHTRLVSFEADLVRNVRSALQLLWGGVLFVLLIAAVNITNLSLSRANGRVKEMATRHALGAPRSRVIRQLVTETTVLTLVGGLLGLGVGFASLDALAALGLADIPRAHEIRMDGVVIAFTLGLALVLGLVVGAVPAVHLTRLNLGGALRDDSRTGTAGRSSRLVRRGLVVAEVSLAFVLLIGAGLLLESFRQLLRVDTGFQPQHVLTGRVSPERSRYPDGPALKAYASRALEGIRALPGVTSAGVGSHLPFTSDNSSSVIVAEGYVMAPGESVVSPNQRHVTPGYLETLGVSLKRGRFFREGDVPPAPSTIIVDEQLARKFWPHADPIGRRMYLPKRPEEVLKPGPDTVWLQVIGVVGNIKSRGLVEGEDARVGAYYLPFAQDPPRHLGFVVRSDGRADSGSIIVGVQRVLASIDPELQLNDVLAMPERIERSLNPRRAPMLLSLGFGLVALLLASLGIYGVLSFQVGQRTREMGIRMALGSDAGGILRLVLREGVVLVLVGLAGGLAGAVAIRGLIASQLYGVGPLDVGVMAVVSSVLMLAALLACFGPARRASKVDPVVALAQR